jgi:hypothetical protein
MEEIILKEVIHEYGSLLLAIVALPMMAGIFLLMFQGPLKNALSCWTGRFL